MKKKIAITKEKVLIALFVMIYAVVALSLISKVGAEHIEHAKRQKELSNMQAYEVYSSYVMTRDSYYVYMMCNPEYSISDVIHNFFGGFLIDIRKCSNFYIVCLVTFNMMISYTTATDDPGNYIFLFHNRGLLLFFKTFEILLKKITQQTKTAFFHVLSIV